jgi:hypothetical protein
MPTLILWRCGVPWPKHVPLQACGILHGRLRCGNIEANSVPWLQVYLYPHAVTTMGQTCLCINSKTQINSSWEFDGIWITSSPKDTWHSQQHLLPEPASECENAQRFPAQDAWRAYRYISLLNQHYNIWFISNCYGGTIFYHPKSWLHHSDLMHSMVSRLDVPMLA